MNPVLLRFTRLFFSLAGRLSPAMATRLAERLFTRVPYSKRRENEIDLLEVARKFTVIAEDGTELAAYRWGNDMDPVILFVHGWTATATCFLRFIEAFVAKGYQVISFDATGHGNSRGKHASLPVWADSLRAVNADIGHVDTIVGHSLGAAAILISLSNGLDTERAVLLSPPTSVREILEKYAAMIALPEGGAERLSRYLWKKYKYSAARYGEDWEDIMCSKYTVPTLIVHDRNDREVDIENARWLARRWPQAEFVETERLGHRRILLSMKVVSLVLAFVQKDR